LHLTALNGSGFSYSEVLCSAPHLGACRADHGTAAGGRGQRRGRGVIPTVSSNAFVLRAGE
jgi:hypothetical protein